MQQQQGSLKRSNANAGAKANSRTTVSVSNPVPRDWLIGKIVNKLNEMMKSDGITMLHTSKNSTPQQVLAAETQRLDYLKSLTPERLAEVTKIGTNSERRLNMTHALNTGFFRDPHKTSPQRGTKSPPRLRQRVHQPGLKLEDIQDLLTHKGGGYKPKTKHRKLKRKTRRNYKR